LDYRERKNETAATAGVRGWEYESIWRREWTENERKYRDNE
jgi:hypothetical protein